MANTDRVDKSLFAGEHYLGKPADDTDRIIIRRLSVLERYPEFFNKTMSCIEVGCGEGSTITRVAGRFDRCLGIDIHDYSEAFAEQVKKNAAPNTTFRIMDLEKESPSETFYRLISFEVIEHFQQEDTVKAFYNLLAAGGMAAISVPNKWWIFETHGARLPLLPWNRVPFFSWLPKFIHERFANARIYTLPRIKKLMERHGFTVVDHQYITAPMDVLKEGRLKQFLVRNVFRGDTTRVPFLSTSIFLLLQKKTAQ